MHSSRSWRKQNRNVFFYSNWDNFQIYSSLQSNFFLAKNISAKLYLSVEKQSQTDEYFLSNNAKIIKLAVNITTYWQKSLTFDKLSVKTPSVRNFVQIDTLLHRELSAEFFSSQNITFFNEWNAIISTKKFYFNLEGNHF